MIIKNELDNRVVYTLLDLYTRWSTKPEWVTVYKLVTGEPLLHSNNSYVFLF